MAFGKANTLGLHSRNMTKWATESLPGFQYLLNLLHSWSIWCLDLIGYWLQGHLNSSLGKNLSLYLPVSAWLVIALEALVHKELECPKFWTHGPPLMYDSSSRLLLPSTRLRNCLPFISGTWNIIFYLLTRSSHSDFLLKSQESLLGSIGISLKDLVSISMTL